MGLTDIWRLRNPTTKQFTFFPGPNPSFGRKNYIWTSKELVPRISKIEILPRTLSEHNSLYLELKGKDPPSFRWRMNESLFNDQKIVN